MVVVRRFGGREFRQPGVAVQNVALDIGQPGSVLTGRMIIVGESQGSLGGGPAVATDIQDSDKVITLNSPYEARQRLRGGKGLEAVLKAFQPSGSFQGPSSIGFLRVNPATRATGNLKDATPVNVIDLNSVDYGVFANRINVAIATGTDFGKKLTVNLDADTIIVDDIRKQSLTVRYNGNATTATVSVTNTALTTALAGDQTDGSLNLNILFSDFPTINSLVAHINSQFGYVATVVAADPSNASAELDNAGPSNIKALTVTLESDLQAVIDSINGNGLFLTAALTTGANRKPVANTVNAVFLVGGSEGTTTNNDWIVEAERVLEGESVQIVDIQTGTLAIIQSYAAHALNMSAPGVNRNRVIVSGSEIGDSKATIKSNAKLVNSEHVLYVGGGVKAVDSNGNLVLMPGYLAGAMFAGVWSGNPVTQPGTHVSILVQGLEFTLTSSEKDDFIDAGVAGLENVDGVIRMVRSVSTYQPPLIQKNEFSVWRTILSIASRVAARAERGVAKPGTKKTILSVENGVISELQDTEQEEWIIADPNDPTGNPASKNLLITLSGDQISITYQANVVVPVNFIFVTESFTVLVTQ